MAMNFTLDELKTIAGIFTPAPVAPVAPVAAGAPLTTIIPPAGSNDMTSMAKDIQYLVKGYDEMKAQLQKMGDTHVTLVDMANHIGDDNKKHTDEDKIRDGLRTDTNANTISITQVKTWGAATLLGIGVAETLIIHFWH